MKNSHIFICFSIYFLALVPSTANGKVAASLSNLPNIRAYDTRNKVKMFRHKRGTVDYCEKFLPKNGKKVTSCVPLEDFDPVCTEAECPNKPSYPSEINHVFYLNKTTRKLHLNITWGKPLFGINNLCGFQVDIASLRNPLGTICTQLNSKDVYSYSIPNVIFHGKYNITITSLPAVQEDIDKSCKFITVESEDECTVLRKHNESLPWKCNIQKNFPVVCKNGSINVTLAGLHNTVVDYYYSEITRRGSPLPGPESIHTRDQPFAAYSNLTLGAEYYLYVTIFKGGQRQLTRSELFTCKGDIPPSIPPSIPPTPEGLLLIILPVVISCIALFSIGFIFIKCKLASKLKSLLGTRHQPMIKGLSGNNLHQDTPEDYSPRVVFVYPFGCRYLEELVVEIGHLLDSMGCQCVLDLYMEGDRNIFMMRKIEELLRDDYVILLNYRDTNSESQNALRCHEHLICNQIFSHLLRRNNFIAIQFDAKETINLATNICFASNAREGLQRFIRIIWGIPRYTFCQKYPQENAIEIDPDLENKILQKLAIVNAMSHENCQAESCRKGREADDNMPVCSPVSNLNATSTNSFGSYFTDHDVVIYDQHKRVELSRLSSSEPLLINV